MAYKPNVLIVTFELGKKVNGGVGRVIDNLISSLEGKIKFDVNHLKWSKSGSCFHSNILRKNGKGYKLVSKGEYISVLLNAIKEEKYNIVHFSYNGEEIANCILAIKSSFPKIKVVYSCHSIAKYEIDIRKNGVGEVESEEKIVHNIDFLHLLNEVSLNYFQASYPEVIATTNYTFVPNGISVDEFKNSSWLLRKKLQRRLKKDDICIICISRWSYGKGIEFIADAVPEVLKHRKNVKFILAGRKKKSWENGVDKYVAFVDSKIKPYRKNIIRLGWLNHKKRNTLFSIAHICVMPSLMEYLPYSILEPMINKVPIVSSEIDSVGFMLEKNKECIFFEPENANDLASNLIHLIDDVDAQKTMASNAFSKGVAVYNWERAAKMYIDMYTSVLTQAPINV